MMRRILLICTAVLFLSTALSPASAQRRKRPNVAKAKAKTETEAPTPTREEILFQELLPATAKVMFVDSVVVDKDAFLDFIQLNKEAGYVSRCSKFFERQLPKQLSAFVNEYGNACHYAALINDSTSCLFYMDKLGKKWDSPRRLKEIENHCSNPLYPFVMADGVTLYFSAQGENSLGGYDIFMTLYDSDSGTYYEPSNIGLPFNSSANDYLMAIDEIDNLGWLVSDRNQPENKVCIYTFEPMAVRQGYDGDNLSDTELTRFAKIESIKDTWAYGDRNAALQRAHNRTGDINARSLTGTTPFVLNDNKIVRGEHNLRTANGRKLLGQWISVKKKIESNDRQLGELRLMYEKQGVAEKRKTGNTILRLEVEQLQLREECQKLAKQIRTEEN